MLKALENIGRIIIGIVQFAGEAVVLLGATIRSSILFFSRLGECINQMYLVGVQSLPVTLIFSMFSGMILALQIGIEFEKFDQIALLGSTVASAMTKEWGPMMTAIILTARAGSAMAAELSVMKVSEEIDALEVMSINPTRYLVLPRVVAMIFMCICLSILSSFIGTCGGYLVFKMQFSTDPSSLWILSDDSPSFHQYFASATSALDTIDLYSGLVKSAVFGLVIAIIACARGLLATKGAAGVGVAVRETVVNALIVIIVLNYIISSLFVMME